MRRYNAPTTTGTQFFFHFDGICREMFLKFFVGEVAAFVPDNFEPINYHRNIQLHLTGGGVQYITDLNAAYHPLHYPLLFPCGKNPPFDHPKGWHTDIPTAFDPTKMVTPTQWAAFHLHERSTHSKHLLQSARLFQEFCNQEF